MNANKTLGRLKKQEEESRKKPEDIIQNIVKSTKTIKEILAIILFGSYVKGEYIPGKSDIDLLFILDSETECEKIEEKIHEKIRKQLKDTRITVHPVFRYRILTEEDKPLLMRIAQEGKILYNKALIVIGKKELGLTPYVLVRLDTALNDQKTRNKLTKLLHGYKHTYTYKGQKKTKEYQGLIDGTNAIQAGKGAILIKQEHLTKLINFTKKIRLKL